MRLFLYYSLHSFKNQVKKLFKTWVLVFFLACFLIGAVIGGVIGFLTDGLDEDIPPYEEELPEGDVGEDVFEEDVLPEKSEIIRIVDLVVSLAIIAILLFSFVGADKNGSAIFTMADVNLLFSAPMKPQSVLFFKLMTQILITLVASLYLIIELPVFAVGFGLGIFSAIAFIVAWITLFAYAKLLNVFVYTLASTKLALKKYIRPAAVVIVLLTVAPIALTYAANPSSFFNSAGEYLSLRFGLYLPIYGWIKGMVIYALEGNIIGSVISFLVSVLGIVLAVFGIWRIKADFYEDALAHSEETATQQAAQLEGTLAKRGKDRADRIKRDAITKGSGANVFFFKAVLNRFRFAYLKIFTKTTVFYLLISVGLAAVLRIFADVRSFLPIGITLAVLVFFRSMGNPLAHDMEKPYFVTVPASPHEKVFFSLMGGSFDTALDTLPPLVIAGIVMGKDLWLIPLCWLLGVSVDYYANNIMLFIELSLPSSISNQVKQMILVMFIYFGLVPILVTALAVQLLLEKGALTFVFSSVAALFIGSIFFIFSPLFLARGRK